MSPQRRAGAATTSLRTIGMPRALTVRVDAEGTPVAVARAARGSAHIEVRVEQIDEVWRVAEAWWREAPQARTYYRVVLDGGRPLTLFRDDAAGAPSAPTSQTAWYEQPYSAPTHEALR